MPPQRESAGAARPPAPDSAMQRPSSQNAPAGVMIKQTAPMMMARQDRSLALDSGLLAAKKPGALAGVNRPERMPAHDLGMRVGGFHLEIFRSLPGPVANSSPRVGAGPGGAASNQPFSPMPTRREAERCP